MVESDNGIYPRRCPEQKKEREACPFYRNRAPLGKSKEGRAEALRALIEMICRTEMEHEQYHGRDSASAFAITPHYFVV